MLELNKLYNMDCMQGMKEFPDGFFDLAIVDPRKSGASSGGGLHVGSLYAYVRRYACRVRRSLFSSGLEREQRRKI